MSYERKDGDISIFRNEYKKKETQPDYRGSALIDGMEFQVSLWTKNSTKGEFFAGRIEIKLDEIMPKPVVRVEPKPAERVMPEPADYETPVVDDDQLPF